MFDVTWRPENVSHLFTKSELDGPVERHLSAEAADIDTGAPLPVTDYDYSLSPPDAAGVFHIDAQDGGVTLQADALTGLFTDQVIEFRIGDYLRQVGRWADVPESASHIIKFRPSNETKKAFTLTVSAKVGDEAIEHSWSFAVTQDWASGQQQLKDAVNARS